MFFYNDYLNSHEKKIFFNEEFSNYYRKYLPDLVVVIPQNLMFIVILFWMLTAK